MAQSRITITLGDCVEVLNKRNGPLFDSVCCDPPYHLQSIVDRFGRPGSAPAKVGETGAFARASKGFMGQEWDGGDVAFRPETWRAIYDQLKPGGHMVAFSGSRTYHRMACAIEDAGFEIRDMLTWNYGSGFPKSHDISKAIDKAAGVDREIIGQKTRKGGNLAEGYIAGTARGDSIEYKTISAPPEAGQWDGWGTALKPSLEPICLARKPLSEKTIAANVLKWGTGALNIGATRIGTSRPAGKLGKVSDSRRKAEGRNDLDLIVNGDERTDIGRWPANTLHDGSHEVVSMFPGDGEDSAARFFFSTPQDIPCGLCGLPCGMSKWNVNTAETPLPTNGTLNANIAGEGVPDLLQTESEASQKALKKLAPNAVANSSQCHQPIASTVAENVLGQVQESLARIAKSAENLCASCGTVIAQNLVALKQGQDPESLRFPVSISEANALILRQNLAAYVAGMESTDIMTTIPSLKMLLGSVFHAIEKNMQRITENQSELSEKSKRIWYSGKASKLDRLGSKHPTVKPVDLMRWLIKLITPPGGLVLEPFAGSGKTGIAAMADGFSCEMIDLMPEHVADIERQLAYLRGEGALIIRDHDNQPIDEQSIGGLFA